MRWQPTTLYFVLAAFCLSVTPVPSQHVDLSIVLAGLDEPGETWNAAAPQLRAQGPHALDSVLALRRVIEGQADSPDFEARVASAAKLQRLDRLIDLVANQPHAHASGLFWYHELARALDEAQRAHRPILLVSHPEGDCSRTARLFALALYANDDVREFLHRECVLCAPDYFSDSFQSLDQPPEMQVGLPGHSIHLMLDASSRPVHAITGPVAPARFLAWLTDATSLAGQTYQLTDAGSAEVIAGCHRRWVRDPAAIQPIDGVELDVSSRLLFERAGPWFVPGVDAAREWHERQEVEAYLTRSASSDQEIHTLFIEGIFTRSVGILTQKLRQPQ